MAHFEDFVQCYFAHRADDLYFPAATPGDTPDPDPTAPATPAPATPAALDDHVPDNEPSSEYIT